MKELIASQNYTIPAVKQADPSSLSEEELTRLRELEIVIKEGLATFIAVSVALTEIRSSKLYRSGFPTFELYCRERWNMKRWYANTLIRAGRVVENLGAIAPTPTNEYQVRALADLPPEDQRMVWEEAVRTAPDGKVTGGHVEEVKARLGLAKLKKLKSRGLADNTKEETAVQQKAVAMFRSLNGEANNADLLRECAAVLIDRLNSIPVSTDATRIELHRDGTLDYLIGDTWVRGKKRLPQATYLSLSYEARQRVVLHEFYTGESLVEGTKVIVSRPNPWKAFSPSGARKRRPK
jgi:hypothetical protein